MVGKDDIQSVAKSIKIVLSEEQINYIQKNYESERKNDPTATWNLIVEDMIYSIIKLNN